MRQEFIFLFYVIFFLNSCDFQESRTVLEALPDSMDQVYFVRDSIKELDNWTDANFQKFYAEHPKLFTNGNTIFGKTSRSEPLLIQECKNNVYQKWLEQNEMNRLEFHDWEIYKMEVNDAEKPLFLSYDEGVILISSAGYLVEEALLGMEGEIRNLMATLPEIKRLGKGETYQRIKNLSAMEFVEIEKKINPFLEHQIVGEIKENDTLYFQGEIIDLNYQLKKDTFSKKILSFIPKDINYAGVYAYENSNSKLLNELSVQTTLNYATFFLTNELGPNHPFLIINLGKENPKALEKLENKYGILAEINDYFLPIVRINMNKICQEFKMLPYAPCISNPYVFVMGEYLIFAESLNSIDTYLEGFALNHSFKNNALLNHIVINDKSLAGDFHYFKSNIKNTSLEKEMVLSLKSSDEKGINSLLTYVVQDEKEKKTIKKTSTYSLGKNIASEVFVLPNKKEGKYFICQDSSNTVYFVSQDNRLVHSVLLDEKIMSEIYHFNDLETQNDRYIFNTKNKIYLLDAKGENLHDFPMELSSPASNGIGFINIENTFSIYAFLACENGNFYGYDVTKGLKPMPSWNPLINTGAIQNKMTFLEGETETHYAYMNKDRELISLDRKAVPRFEAVPVEEEFTAEIQVDPTTKGKERFVLHNGKGKLKIINTKGESFFLSLNDGKEKGGFLLMNIQGEEEKEYVFFSENKITIHSYENDGFREILNIDNVHGLNEIFEVKINNEYSLLGGLNTKKKRIFLLNHKGELMDGFPLEGDKNFSVFPFSNGRYIITTSFKNTLVNYLHNIDF